VRSFPPACSSSSVAEADRFQLDGGDAREIKEAKCEQGYFRPNNPGIRTRGLDDYGEATLFVCSAGCRAESLERRSSSSAFVLLAQAPIGSSLQRQFLGSDLVSP
jgi:hypothetical protein